MRPRARISASPTAVMTAAMPSPNATTRTTPNAGTAARDRPEQDQQRAGRRDQPAGQPEHEQAPPRDRGPRRGQVAVGDTAVAVRLAELVVVTVSLVYRSLMSVLMFVGVIVAGRSGGTTTAQLADQHPRADRHDAGRREHGRRPHDEVRVEHALRPDDHRGQGEDAERVRGADRQPEADRVHGCPAGADEVRGHQRLAMPRGQGVSGPERRGRRQRQQHHEGRQVRRLEEGRDLASNAARNGRHRPRVLHRGWIGGDGIDRRSRRERRPVGAPPRPETRRRPPARR